MNSFSHFNRWIYAVIPACILALIAFYPQLSLWAQKGGDWNGAYFVSNFDEVAYSAYVQALINGKPRKYDPYLAKETEHESFYSIQFIPAFAIALPARLVGIDASTAFIFLTLFSASLAAVCIFWLLFSVTDDPLLSACGVLVICCMGAAVAYQGELRAWADGQILVDYMPFLRRYQPGFGFPLFFVFCGTVWRALTADGRRTAVVYSTIGGVVFGLLVFSYFYLWTAAAAWLSIVYVLHLVAGRQARRYLWTHGAIVGTFAAVSLIPYFFLIADRSPNIDAIQLLANTRLPDISSPSMLFGLAVAIAIAVLLLARRLTLAPLTLFTLAFAAMPVFLFNQQVITGRSLQPVHYELFIANYVVLTAAVLFCSMVYRAPAIGPQIYRKFAISVVAALAAMWGTFEAYGSAQRNMVFADLRDTSIPAIKYIDSLEQQATRANGSAVVMATNTGTSDMIPTIASLRPLWSSHSSSVGGLGVAENKRLFRHFLVLSGFSEHDVAEALHHHAFEMTAALFGSERALPSLGQGAEPITVQEIEDEVRGYSEFRTSFSRESASDPELSYVIVQDGYEPNFSILDRWYQRDEGTVAGPLRVYNVTLRR